MAEPIELPVLEIRTPGQWTDADFVDAFIEPAIVSVEVARDEPGEDAHHPASVEDVAHALFENVLGGFETLREAVDEIDNKSWQDLAPDRREWWMNLVRDAVWCGRPLPRDQYSHVALLRGEASTIHG